MMRYMLPASTEKRMLKPLTEEQLKSLEEIRQLQVEAIHLCQQRAFEMQAILAAQKRHQIIILGLRHFPRMLKSYPYADLSQYSLQSHEELMALVSNAQENVTTER